MLKLNKCLSAAFILIVTSWNEEKNIFYFNSEADEAE